MNFKLYNSNNKIKILWNDGDGKFSSFNPVGIRDEKLKEYLKFEVILNPFNSFTKFKFKFKCTEMSTVSLKIVDMLGLEKICLLNNQKKSTEEYVTSWDRHDTSDNKCEPGGDIMKLEINGNQYSKKIIKY
jgi:hypothetical protein